MHGGKKGNFPHRKARKFLHTAQVILSIATSILSALKIIRKE